MKEYWHRITHILSGFLHRDLEIISIYKDPKEAIRINFVCTRCQRRMSYEWNWSIYTS